MIAVLRKWSPAPPMPEAVIVPHTPNAEPKPKVAKATSEDKLFAKVEKLNDFLTYTVSELELGVSATLVWIELWRSTNKDGYAQMSYKLLGDRLNLHINTISSAVLELKDKRLLKVTQEPKNFGPLRDRAGRYKVHPRPV